MKDVVFVTGNEGKAKYFSELIGMEINYHAADTDELQSLDLVEITTHKAKQAYEQLRRPVIIEDTGLVIKSMGKLPGPFIKWFEKEVGLEAICRLADIDPNRAANAASTYIYYDGRTLKTFEGSLDGTIAKNPKGRTGFGWNPIFIPEGQKRTLAEMDDETFKKAYIKIKPILEVKKFLENID